MSLTDPIANMLTCIRNAVQARKETVDVPASKLSGRVLDILKEDSYIEDYRLLKDDKQGVIKIYLKYEQSSRSSAKSVITGIKRISKPGLRVYASHDKLPRVLNGLGTAVISTSKGVVNDREARKLKVGGEVLCYIW